MCHQCKTSFLNDILTKEILYWSHQARAIVLVIITGLHGVIYPKNWCLWNVSVIQHHLHFGHAGVSPSPFGWTPNSLNVFPLILFFLKLFYHKQLARVFNTGGLWVWHISSLVYICCKKKKKRKKNPFEYSL